MRNGNIVKRGCRCRKKCRHRNRHLKRGVEYIELYIEECLFVPDWWFLTHVIPREARTWSDLDYKNKPTPVLVERAVWDEKRCALEAQSHGE